MREDTVITKGTKAMKATIEIQCDNAAFEDDPRPEIARILTELAGQLGTIGECPPGGGLRLVDVNGNHVGDYVEDVLAKLI